MSLVVQKFGGSSVADKERIMNAARTAIRAKKAGHQVIVVVSARGDTTDELIELAKEISEHPPTREMDMLLSTGEQISIALVAMAILELGEKAISLTGAQVGIVTDSSHTKARIKSIFTERLREALDSGHIVIVAGFQGIDGTGNITTLGRGGSDTTAVALAAVMKQAAEVRRPSSVVRGGPTELQDLADNLGDGPRTTDVACDIYTDVDGIFTTDPRLVPDARKLDVVSYDEMLELASVGANVLSSRSIEFARKFSVPLQKRSSFSDVEGTWIVPEATWMSDVVVVGAAMVKDEARVAVIDVPDRPGVSHKIFAAIAAKNIAVDMIAQNVGSEGKASIGFTVPAIELHATLRALESVVAEMGVRIQSEEGVSKVSIVGTGMRTHTGVAQRMFASLSDVGVNMKMITTGDIKISVLVDKADGVKALRAVHAAFRLDQPRPGAGLPIAEVKTGGSGFERRTIETSPQAKDDQDLLSRLSHMEDIVVSDVALDEEQGRITIFNIPDQPGNCTRIFHAVAQANIVVDMIVANPAEKGRSNLSFSVPIADLQRTLEVTQQAAKTIAPDIVATADSNIARLIVSGIGMRTHTGVARTMFGTLAERGINIAMINTSEIRVSVVVDRSQGQNALEALRSAFGL
ncbi:MAG: aspartate kinase [Gemmataceae bacterium]|nr:aspartate kinase [Gemmataceae bacterium]